MKALTDKIITALEHERDNLFTTEKQAYKNGISKAIDIIETITRDAEFEEVARQLMKHMAEKYHPHHSAIVTSTNAELLEGEKSTGETMDYVPD